MPQNHTIQLTNEPTHAPKHLSKDDGKERLKQAVDELVELQNLLYAEAKHSVLVILQGMDASGKDGLIRDVFSSLNPQGIYVHSFKKPTEDELAHDFLWRIHKQAPQRRYLHVFNRSQYEDVLVRYVHQGLSLEELRPYLDAINDFERQLTRFGPTTILKFFLHVSEEKQQERLAERVSNPAKRWKYDAGDVVEASHRAQFYEIYEAVFQHCDEVPWTVVPADQNWYKAMVVAEAVRDALRGLKMAYPGLPNVDTATGLSFAPSTSSQSAG